MSLYEGPDATGFLAETVADFLIVTGIFGS
jgi:hypothetical protein